MDFWAENSGHLTQYNRFNTVPSRICSQSFPDRQPAPQYPAYYGDQQHKTTHSGYWPTRDVPNWTNQEPPSMTSSQNFPFGFGHPIQRRYSDVGEQQRREARDWTTYQQQQERGMQHEGWSYHPAHCKRDLSKKNESNFRELEAWALRYSHSLPRRRRIEAELRGARQDNTERRDMQTLNMQDSTQWERVSRQQAPNYCQNTPTSPGYDAKDKLCYQTKQYSQPPNYNAPPAYSVQLRTVSMPQKSESQNVYLQQVLKRQEREVFEKCPFKVETQEQVKKLHVQGRPSNDATKVIEGRKFKLNKKAGGMTIFCLVSRIADTERESIPLSEKPSECVQQRSSYTSQPLKLADEVDFKIQTPAKHATRSPYSKLQAIPICKESLSKIAEKSVPKTNEVSTYEKLAVQSKYPLWRRPSFTSNTEADAASTSCSNWQDKEKSSCRTGKETAQGNKDDAMLMIDTTCVVVKLEVLQGPKMEQVQYLGSEEKCKSGQNVTNETKKDNPNDESVKEQAEDFRTSLEQEAKDNEDKDESEDVLAEKSALISETLEERGTRIRGLRESRMMQLKEECIEADQMLKVDIELKDLQKESTISPNENEQLREDVLAEKSALISETLEERGTRIRELRESIMMQLKEECIEADQMLKVDIELKDLQKESTISPNENEQPREVTVEDEPTVDTAVSKESGLKERGEDLEIERKEQCSTIADNQKEECNSEEGISEQFEEQVKVIHSSDVLNCHELALGKEEVDNEVFTPVSQLQVNIQNNEGLTDVEGNTATFDISESSTIQSTLNEANVATLSDSDLNSRDKNPDQEVIQRDLDGQDADRRENICGQTDLSEPVPELSQKDNATCNYNGAKDDHIMVHVKANLDSGQVSDELIFENSLEVDQNKETPTIEVHEEMHRSINIKPDLEDDVTCIEGDNSEVGMDIHIGGSEMQEIAGNLTVGHDWQEIGESSAIEYETSDKGQSEITERIEGDILESNLNDSEQETQKDSSDGSKDLFKFQEKEEGTQPIVNVQLEAVSEDLEVSQKREAKDNVKGTGQDNTFCTDIDQTSSEKCEEAVPKDAMKYDQEEDVCTNKSQVQKETVEEANNLEKILKVEAIQSVQLQETAPVTFEDADMLVAYTEEANEAKTEEETDLKQHVLVSDDNTEMPDSKTEATDLQQCKCKDTSPSCVTEQELTKEKEKSDQDIKINREVCESSSASNNNPNVNNYTAIMQRSSVATDLSLQSIPSTSTCNNCESSSCEEEGKYPKSLWDAVSRIRKHTAPDSENEEDELMDSWDRESLADNAVSLDTVLDRGYLDLTEGVQPEEFYRDLNVQDDTLSQCSNSSQGSDGTIVDEEDLEDVTNTDLTGVSEEYQDSDGEKSIEINEETVKKTCQEFDEEAEIPDEIML